MPSLVVPSVLCALTAVSHALTLDVAQSGGNASSPLQYGLIFEDINHAGDGGLYAELINNRAFQFGGQIENATTDPWKPVNSVLTIATSNPLSAALPFSMNVASSATANNGRIGMCNGGWWGIDVHPDVYTGTFYTYGAYTGDFGVSLEGAKGEIFASLSLPSATVDSRWTQYSFTMNPPAGAADLDNSFCITFDPSKSAGSLNFNFISLFPPTYNGRPNGNRIDLMQALGGTLPSFLRLPGGNNLEGTSTESRWKWNETIGPLIDRPGRDSTWTYWQTDGLGLAEYLNWCMDLDMEPMLAVWDGHGLGAGLLGSSGPTVAQNQLQPYVDDVMNELEYILGDVSTKYGALRASHGYPNPWKLNYVEVGNEDYLTGGEASYVAYRYNAFSSAISAVYPHIQIIASTIDTKLPASNQVAGDYHLYAYPDYLVSKFNMFDQNNTAWAKSLIGEYANTLPNQGGLPPVPATSQAEPFPFWEGSVAEAIFLLGAERNAGSTLGAAYAPILQRLSPGASQWSPDLISFTSLPSETVLSTSYHMVSLLSGTRFTETRAVNISDGGFGPAYFAAGQNTDTGAYILKAAIYNSTADVPFTVRFEGVAAGTIANLTVLTAPDPYSTANIGSDPVAYDHKTLTAASDGSYVFSLPNLSVAVLLTSTPGEESALAAARYGQFPGVGGYGGCEGGQAKGNGWNAGYGAGNGC